MASLNGRKDVAIALAEKGADLNIQYVSDCYLLVHDSEENAGHFETAYTSVYVYMCMYIPARVSILSVCVFDRVIVIMMILTIFTNFLLILVTVMCVLSLVY